MQQSEEKELVFLDIAKVNNWGHERLYVNKRLFKPNARETIKFPDGTVAEVDIISRKVSFSVPDHGNSYTGINDAYTFDWLVHGIPIELPLYEVKVLRPVE
jgi:hypothetical protein